MPGRSFLVTGAAGFIGTAVVRALLNRGHIVRALDDESRGSRGRLHDGGSRIDWVIGDIRDPLIVTKAVEDVDAVVHLAAVNGTQFFYTCPDLVLEVAVKGILNVLDACIAHGVGELFVASSSEVYQTPPKVPTNESVPLSIPDPLNPRYSYAGGKIISELLALNYGRKKLRRAVIFRPHNVYGPDMGWEHVIPQLTLRILERSKQSRGPIELTIEGSGEQTRSFVYIDDFVAGLMRVMEKGEHLSIYNIGTEEEISIKELACEIASYLGRALKIIPTEPKSGGPLRRCPSIKRLRDLGFSPAVSLKDGLARTIPWYIENDGRNPWPADRS
jgi:nucleoside-diphosphate-sugar epimerase